jgi:hypothetical protein
MSYTKKKCTHTSILGLKFIFMRLYYSSRSSGSFDKFRSVIDVVRVDSQRADYVNVFVWVQSFYYHCCAIVGAV